MPNRITSVSDVSSTNTGRQSVSITPGPGPSVMRYPLAAAGKDTDFLQIKCFQYMPPDEDNRMINTTYNTDGTRQVNVNANANRYSTRFDAGQQQKWTAYLPVPAGITDQNTVTWGEDRLNPLQAALAGGSLATMTSGNPLGTVQAMMQEVGSGAANLGDEERNMIMTYLGGQAANMAGANVDPSQLVTRATGKIVQSNLELLFKNVNLRAFNFVWQLAPRNIDEAREVKTLVRSFKQAMAPQDGSPSGVSSDVGTGATGWFIGSPDVFQLEYKKGNSKHPFLHSFKPCALTDISVNYSAAGMYSTYEDGTPTHMNMTLSFKEINPIYNQDYDHASGRDGVGY